MSLIVLAERPLLLAVGDFNIANNTFGDCNVEDDSYGIGGPEYNGCAKVSLQWMHAAMCICMTNSVGDSSPQNGLVKVTVYGSCPTKVDSEEKQLLKS